MELLSRDEFRAAVLARDGALCVICHEPAVDAHHILERRLFPDGGYYLDNGASLCAKHHLAAESTELSCEEIRSAAGIRAAVLPEHFYHDEQYDKWGNVILPDQRRLRGELFDDPSVQKVLAPMLSYFTQYVKYPRTLHLPWSPGKTNDDRVMTDITVLREAPEIVVSLKLDGESTSMYQGYIHARSLEYAGRIDRDWVRNLHAKIAWEIPKGWRICGENLWATHSIRYEDLPSFFQVHSIWNDRNICLSWDDTEEWSALFGLRLVPVLYRGKFAEPLPWQIDESRDEGYVVRVAGAFHYRQWGTHVGKYVRAGHVQTQAHWTRRIEPNVMRPKP